MKDSITVDIGNCARCAENHAQLTFKKLGEPIESWTHWAPCPNTQEPVLLINTDDDEKKEVSNIQSDTEAHSLTAAASDTGSVIAVLIHIGTKGVVPFEGETGVWHALLDEWSKLTKNLTDAFPRNIEYTDINVMRERCVLVPLTTYRKDYTHQETKEGAPQ